MNQIDYELGLMSSEEDFQNADGKTIAMASLVACNTACTGRHPFNAGKRNSCKNGCNAAYNAKINYIQTSQLTATATDLLKVQSDIATTAVAAAEASAAVTTPPISKKPQETSETTSSNDSDKKGLGTGAKIGIGVGVLALIIGGVFLLKGKK
jgi:uncharacterized membrane protein